MLRFLLYVIVCILLVIEFLLMCIICQVFNFDDGWYIFLFNFIGFMKMVIYSVGYINFVEEINNVFVF